MPVRRFLPVRGDRREMRMKKALICAMLTLALAGGAFLASATPADAIGIAYGRNKSRN